MGSERREGRWRKERSQGALGPSASVEEQQLGERDQPVKEEEPQEKGAVQGAWAWHPAKGVSAENKTDGHRT